MSNGLNMRVLLQLQTKQFQQGVNAVKKSLGVLKNSFLSVAGALGAGLGLNSLISSFKEISTRLSSVQTTMKNVSEGFGEYTENMQFLHKIAKTYGQDLLALTESFAQFRAAAKNSNLELEDQRYIYEAMTQAAGAFQLSADQTKNAMLAVTQMLSKGKVASEELRRQLGNVLPGAFTMMAKAAQLAGITVNGTTAELEKAMKDGRVMAEDVLPAFAQILKTTTANANFDTIQSSLNRLKNSWYEFVNNSNFTNFYKGLVDAATTALDRIGANFTSFKTTAISAFSAIAGTSGFKKLVAAGEKATADMKSKMLSLQKEYDNVNKKLSNVAEYRKRYVQDENGQWWVSEKKTMDGIVTTQKRIVTEAEKESEIAEYRNNLTKQELNLREEIGSLNEKTTKHLSKTQMALRGIGAAFKNIIASVAGTLAITAVLFAITKIVSSLYEWYKEQKRINGIVDETMKAVDRTSDATVAQISKVQTLQKVLSQSNLTEKQRLGYINELNRELGLAKDKQLTIKSTADDITTAINNWKDRIMKAARAAAIFGKIQELTAKNLSLEERASEIRSDENYNKTRTSTVTRNTGFGGTTSVEVLTKKARELNRELKNGEKEIEQNNIAIDRLLKKAETEGLDDPFGLGGSNGGNGGDGGSTGVAKGVQKVLDEYMDTVKKLNNQREKGAISEEEYSNELWETISKTWKAIAAFDNLEETLKKLGKEYQDVTAQLAADFALQGALDDLDEMLELRDKVAKDHLDNFMSEAEKYTNYFKKRNDAIFAPEPIKGKRNTFGDYKKTDGEIYGEQADIAEKYAGELSDFAEAILKVKNEFGTLDPYAQAILDRVIEKLKDAKANAKNLRDKANASQWIEDVKKLKKELSDVKFDAFKNVAESMDRLVRSSKNLADAWATLSDNELDEQTEDFFNKLNAGLSILNEGIQLFETFRAVMQAFTKVQETKDKLQKASSAAEAISTAKRVGLLGAEAAAETASASATVAAEGAKKTAIEGTTQAAATNAVVGAASSVASIPVVGWAMAGVAIAGMIAAIAGAMSKKFAGGGVVNYGTSSGDRTLARVNRNEMILTPSHQTKLWNAINSGNLGGGGQVEFKIKGENLIGAINNYNTIHR